MLLDFNLSDNTRRREGAARAAIGGTLPYMAPEHIDAFNPVHVDVDKPRRDDEPGQVDARRTPGRVDHA